MFSYLIGVLYDKTIIFNHTKQRRALFEKFCIYSLKDKKEVKG